MGKSSANKAAGKAAQAQTNLAQQLIGETGPLRNMLIGDATGYLTGSKDVTALPEYGAAKSVAEQQYARAKDSIIANTPEGGALTSALTNLEAARAQDLTGIAGQLSANEANRATQLATFGTAQGSQALAGAAATQAQRAAAESQSNAGKGQAAGQIAAAAILK